MRSERYRLLDWVVNDDMEGLEELGEVGPCAICGRPTRTYSVSFCAGLHLRCCVRLWESYHARMRHEHAEHMLDLLRGRRETREQDRPF